MLQMRIPPLRTAIFFFFNDTATTEIYTLSLHDALPISLRRLLYSKICIVGNGVGVTHARHQQSKRDRKSTRLNSSHDQISYAVFCLKKNTSHILLHIEGNHNVFHASAKVADDVYDLDHD